MTQTFTFNAIGTVHACYKEKFGVPRQPGLVKVESSIEILEPYNRPEAFRELSGFSHIWLMFVFHQTMQQGWNPTVRPPRLGGNERVGVFASRSMFRPNPIGLSVVELKEVRQAAGKLYIDVIGADLIDGTPVLDIKPYVPYVDAVSEAVAGYANNKPLAQFRVSFTPYALGQVEKYRTQWADLEQCIIAVLQLDPRPAYQDAAASQKTEFGMRLYDLDIKWRVSGDAVEVYDLLKIAVS